MTYVPTNLYEIRLYDSDGAFKFIPKHVTRLEFHQRLNAPWNHQITLEYSKENADVEMLREIENDWYIRIFRLDPITQIKSIVYSGLHITLVDQARTSGDLIFNLYGSGYTHLLTRRVVIPPYGYENSDKVGDAETVLKSYVSDCMVSPIDMLRVFDGVTIELDSGEGEYVERSVRYINLLTVCENIADAGNIDFGLIEGEEVGDVLVRARSVWGKDRREGNPAGNQETVFSFLRGNMNIPIYTNNASDEKNYIYIGGPGQGIARQIKTVSSPTTKRWERKEAFIEGRQQETDAALLAAGNAYLQTKKLAETLSFDIIKMTGTRWLVDWELGDLITARYFDKAFDKKIVEVSVVVTGESSASVAELVSVEMQDVRI